MPISRRVHAVHNDRFMTYDPTPADPFSGDEVETCKTCHASK